MKLVRKIVYHYTTRDSFIKMLDGIRDHQINFFASRVDELNDTTELISGFNKLWRRLSYIENLLSINADMYKVSRIGQWNGEVGPKPPSFVRNEIEQCRIHSYVISFSNKKDFLPMWGMYGGKGDGVALGFQMQLEFKENNSVFHDLTVLDGRPYSMRMSYGNFSQTSPSLIFTKWEYYSYYLKVKNIEDPKQILRCQLDFLQKIGMIPAMMLKHKAFSFEAESRLFYAASNDLVKQRINGKGNIRHYIEVGIPLSLIDNIIIGPCVSSCDKKLITAKIKQLGIDLEKVKLSKIPYRDY